MDEISSGFSEGRRLASGQLLSVSVVRKSKSLLDLVSQQRAVVDSRMADAIENATESETRVKKPRRCHQCHTPLVEPVHSGVKTGVGVCSLPHWHACDGNIPEGDECKGKIWAPCPPSDDSASDAKLSEIEVTDSDPEILLKKNNVESASGSNTEKHVEPVVEVAGPNDDQISYESTSDDDASNDKQLLLEKLQEEIKSERERAATAQLALQEKKRQKMLRREQRAAALAEQERLLREQLKKAKSATLSLKPSPKSVATSTKSKNVNKSSESSNLQQKFLSDQVAEHEARQQQKAAQRRLKQQQAADNLSIDGIRKIPDVQKEALELMSKLQEMIPSLAKDPSSNSGHRVTTQPAGVFSHRGRGVHEQSDSYVYVASLGRAVPVVNTLADIPNGCTYVEKDVKDSESEEECSADEDCSLSPEPGHRFLWRRNDDGSKYFVPVTEKRAVSPAQTWSYVLDKATGRYEKCQVSGQQKLNQSNSQSRKRDGLSTPRFVDHRVLTGSAGRCGQVQIHRKREERQPTYVCPDTQPERQGKESAKALPELVHYARECPVSWTTKVTTDKLNPILWSWAYVSHLLATRTGQAPMLAEGELEARLQHFLNVLEITLQTTNQADFAADAWKVARLYHTKVQQKVDCGEYSWLQMLQQWGAATSPHELMAARAEIPLNVKQKTALTDGLAGVVKTGTRGTKKDLEEKKKQICFSWNNCETRGKCKFEVENEGEACPRIHACSWCKTKDFKPLTHQKRFCRKRIEEDGE